MQDQGRPHARERAFDNARRVRRSPQGAEHVKQILVGSILAVSARDLPKFAVLYAFIGAIRWLASPSPALGR